MNTKHTPGPWTAHFEEAYFVTGPDRGRVAMMMNLKGAHGMGGRRSGEESAANCRLIAAAPDLLAACINARDVIATDRQGFVDCHQVHGSRVDDAVAHGLVLVGDGVWIPPDVADALRDYDRALALIDAAISKATGQSPA